MPPTWREQLRKERRIVKKVFVLIMVSVLAVMMSIPAMAMSDKKNVNCAKCGQYTATKVCKREYADGKVFACSIKTDCQKQKRSATDYYKCRNSKCLYDTYGAHRHGTFHTKHTADYGCKLK